MEDRYSIENLIKTFQRHSDLSKKRHLERPLEQREEMERNMKKNDPDDWDFDITLALRSMCGDLMNLHKYTSQLEKEIMRIEGNEKINFGKPKINWTVGEI